MRTISNSDYSLVAYAARTLARSDARRAMTDRERNALRRLSQMEAKWRRKESRQ
ncbi:MAG: hypothetical protein LUC85_04165 [Bacteroidales bacterium]|nr:hypothetical protein [Bacteroidales bacterium]MCD8394015.1 hypothetical protein [Bacteroidales bacterium]